MEKRLTCVLLSLLIVFTLVPACASASGSLKVEVPAKYSIDGKTSYSLSASEYMALLEQVHESIQSELDDMCQGFFHYESIEANEDCTLFTVTVNSVTQSAEEVAAENRMYEMREQYAAYSADSADGIHINYRNMLGDLLWTSDVGEPPILSLENVAAATFAAHASSSKSATAAAPNPAPTPAPTRSEPTYSYILNTNTKKFHYPDCKSVRQMKEKNKWYYDGTRSDVIAMGYDPCGNCHP